MTSKDIVLLIQATNTVVEHAGDLKIRSFDFHNKSKKLCIVLNDELLELQSVQPRKFGSWFINQRVSSSKLFYTASKFDARFLCLKYFEAAPVRYCPLDQTVMSTDGLAAFCVKNAAKLNLGEICDVNDTIDDELIFYRYNATKALSWLQQKVTRLSAVLHKQRLQRAASSAFVNNFDASKQNKVKTVSENANEPQSEDLRQALDIISECISEDLFDKLLAAFNLSKTDLKVTKPVESNKRKADWEIELELEKETLAFSATATTAPTAKPAAIVPAAAVSKTAAATNKSVKVNAAAAKGTKSINSFFTKS